MAKQNLRAGAAKVDITPPIGSFLSGYAKRTKPSQTIDDPLFSKALVLDDGRMRLAIITNDLIWVPADLVAKVRSLIQKWTRIPENNIFISASHTHFGPVMAKRSEWAWGDADEAYVATIIRKMATAAKLASDGLQPARIGFGKGEAHGISYNRRTIRPDGKAVMSWSLPPPESNLRFGPIDPEVGVLRIEDKKGGNVASLINFACHPVSSTERFYAISADYPGETMKLIQAAERGVSLFALGCAGNINPIMRGAGAKRKVGFSLGAEALKVLQWIDTSERARLKARRRKISLPLKRFPSVERARREVEHLEKMKKKARRRDRRSTGGLSDIESRLSSARRALRQAERFAGKRQVESEIMGLSFGDIYVIGLPGEIFVEIGQRIKKRSGLEKLLLVSLANDAIGYVPVRKAYSQGGYEPSVTHLRRGAAELLIEEAVRLLESL